MHVHVARGKRDSVKLKASEHFVPIAESASTNAFFFKVRRATETAYLVIELALQGLVNSRRRDYGHLDSHRHRGEGSI